MGFSDRIRAFFARRATPDLGALEAFAKMRKGVEGFVEPRTATQPTTLLLVDREGDHLRGAVRDPEAAAAFCEHLGIPVYDAAVIGYPRRMREFQARRRQPVDEDLDAEIADLEKRLSEEPSEGTPDE